MSDKAAHSMKNLVNFLQEWIAAGGRRIGQVVILRRDDSFSLRHADDANAEGLAIHHGPQAARDIAKFDAAGAFRPLKSAPSLIRGWEVILSGWSDLALALDFLHPAAWANWICFARGEAVPTALRDTLNRQTGIYQITAQITDAEAQSLVARTCRSDGKCLRRILWPVAQGTALSSLPPEKCTISAPADEAPLLCLEACPLLIGGARRVVRSRTPQVQPGEHD